MTRSDTASMNKDTANKDGLPIRTGNVGLAAGMSKDGVTSVHDKKMPEWVWLKNLDGKQKAFSLLESRDYHERIEDAEIQAGKDYAEAHRVATETEHSRMRQMGFDPNKVEALQKPYIDAAAHEARGKGNTTPKVGNEPYRGPDAGMRADQDNKDRRFILDSHGNRYNEPTFDKLLGQTEIVYAKRAKGSGFAAIDPNSGWVFAKGDSRVGVKKDAERKADDLGRPRLKERFDNHKPQSQQQLREKFKNLHPDARIASVEPKETAMAFPPKTAPIVTGSMKPSMLPAKKQAIAVKLKTKRPMSHPMAYGSS